MRILIIEDDKDLCEALKLTMEKEGYFVDCCNHGNEASFYVLDNVYDAIVLDRMLPGMDGLSILHMIRENQINTPVILATALGDIKDKIAGLDTGADDYITKPYDVTELLARIRAILRRPAKLEEHSVLEFSDLRLNEETLELSCKENVYTLSKKECSLLSYFIKNATKALSRQVLISYVWGADCEVEDGNLDNYIHFLRKRLKTASSRVNIRTIHGIGYRLEEME